MASRIAITQDAQEEILSILQNYTTKVNEEMINLIEKFKSACEETSYENLINQTNEIVYFYNQNVRNNIYEIVEEWTNSRQSIASYCEMARAGQGAVDTAEELMGAMLSEIENNLETIAEVGDIDTSNLDMNDEVYDEIKRATSESLEDIRSVYTASKTEAEELETENAMAGGLFAPIEAVMQSIIKPFDELVSTCLDKIRDDFIQVNEEIRKMSSQTADDVASQGSSIDTEELIGSLFDDIM